MVSPISETPLPALEALFEHLADAVYLIEPETSRIVWGNRMAWEALGLDREEVLDHSVLSLQKDVTGFPQWADIAAAIRGTDCFTFNGRHRCRNGHELAVEVNTTRFLADGREYFLSIARDVTRRAALDASLRDRESQLQFALNEATDGLWDWDLSDDSLFFSPQLKRMLGYGPHEMAPKLETWSDNVHPEDAPLVALVLREHLDGKRVRYEAEYRLRNRNGHYLWVYDRGRVCERDAAGRPTRVVGMVQDVSERKALELRLQGLVANDGLTGLATRQRGEEFIDMQLALCQRVNMPFGLCFCDLDHFKSINDVYGHLVGDKVLRRAAEIMQATMRKSDLVARWGGEEFVIVCPNTNSDGMLRIAASVRRSLATAAWADEFGISPVTASIGIAVFPDHGSDRLGLIGRADSALYRAKGAGRDCCMLAAANC